MFFIVETTKYLDTHNETTSFGYNRVYDTYEEAERDLGLLTVAHLPEGDEVQVIKGPNPDMVNIFFSTEKVVGLSIEVLNKKGEDNQ